MYKRQNQLPPCKRRDNISYSLSFLKGSTGCLTAVAGAAALDVHMLRIALVICVIHTFYSFAVDADSPAGIHGVGCGLAGPVLEAFAAGIVFLLRFLASYHNIALAAALVIIIGTIFYYTFQFCQFWLPPEKSYQNKPVLWFQNYFVFFSGFYSWLPAQTVYIEPVAFQQAAVRSLHGLNSPFLPFLKDSVPGKAAADEPCLLYTSDAADEL